MPLFTLGGLGSAPACGNWAALSSCNPGVWLWGPGYTSGFRLLGLWPGVGSVSVCLGSGGSVGVASCLGFVYGVRVQLWLSGLMYGTWCPGFSVSLWCPVSGIQGP